MKLYVIINLWNGKVEGEEGEDKEGGGGGQDKRKYFEIVKV